jgi:PAS domain S-box-containing protein
MNSKLEGLYRETTYKRKIALALIFSFCGLPILLNFLGIDFSSTISALSKNSRQSGGVTDAQLFGAVSGAIHHALLEWSAVTLSVMVAVASFIHYRIKQDVTVPIIGLALLAAGSVDAFHTLAATRIISASAPNTDFIPFTWALSRIFNAFIMIVAAVFSLWLSKNNYEKINKKLALNIILLAALVFIGLAAFVVFSAASSDNLPRTMFPTAVITRPFDVLPLALFLCGGVFYWLWFVEKSSTLRYALLLSIIPEVITQFHMAFGSTALFDNHFNIAHFLKNIAYGSIFMGILIDLSQTNKVVKGEDKAINNNHSSYQPIKAKKHIFTGKVLSSLAVKIPLAGFVLSLSIALIVGMVFYTESRQLVKDQVVDELKIESQIIKPLIENFYRESTSDITFISHTPPIRGIIQSIEHNDQSNLLLWKDRLQETFIEFLKNKPIYKQISYLTIDKNINSVVTVKNQNGKVSEVPRKQLSRDIKLDALKGVLLQEKDRVYFSKIIYKKNAQNDEMQSSVFVGIPVYTLNHEIFGLVAIEIDFSLFIQRLKKNSLDNVNFYLANSQGDFIYAPDESRQSNSRINLLQVFPSLNYYLSETSIDTSEQATDIEKSIVISQNKLAYYSSITLTKVDQFGQFEPLHLVIVNNSNTYLQALSNMRFRAVILGLSLAILNLALSIVASKRLIRALLLMTRSVSQYEEQGKIGKLPTKENDEVGVLARSFHNLLIKIEQKSTEQKNETIRAENALTKLHAILNSIADAVININDKGEILSFNLAAEKIFGYQENEVLGSNVSMLMPRNYAVEHDGYLQNYTERGHGKVMGRALELPAMRKDGEKFSMHLSISEIKTQEGVVFTGLIRDITVSKLLEAESKRGIQEAKEMAWRLDFALSAPKIGVWDYNINTGVSNWDSRMYELFGFDAYSMKPPEKIWRKSIHSEDIDFVEEQLSQIAKGGEDLHFEYRIVLPDLVIKFVETHAQVLKDNQGHYFRVVGTHRDITEQKNLQVLKQGALDMAEHALLLRSQFLASMSHEIRTPMNGVLGMLGLLEQSQLNKQQHHHLQLASSSAQSLLSLINDILDFSKIEAGKLELEILDFDLRSLLGDFAESMAIKAQEKGLELILDVSAVEQSMVKGDPSRLRQILSNLLGNSIKFTDSGEVLIKASIEKKQSKLLLTCTISDTGIGIPENKITSLFDSFTQVDASTTRKYGGTGLGLAIVKQLSQLMSGDITVISEKGKGSAFTFTVLLEESKQSQQVMPYVDIKGTKILVVDDNVTNLVVLRDQLALWGAEVTGADDGFVALEHIINHPDNFFDVAILDMQMPGMDGATLGKRLKTHSKSKNTKLIMMTSMNERGDANFFAKLGFSAYFPKPATTADLFDALTVILDDSEVLNSAKPLVTHHHIRSLKRTNANREINKNTRILLVEDNRINQAVILGVLSNIGLSADVAGNGIEALSALNSSPFDAPYQLIIMDCQMPEMDGYDATKAIRAGEAKEIHRRVPIIAMTANAMKGDKEKCLAVGMNDYATKPVDAEILHEKIALWVGIDQHALVSGSYDNTRSIDAPQIKNGEDHRNANNSVNDTAYNDEDIVWDKSGLFKRIRNNENLAKKLISMFINEMPKIKNELVVAIEKTSLADVIALSHKITGSAKNLGGINLAKTTQQIEQAAKEENSEELFSLQKEVTEMFTLFIQHLEIFLAKENITGQPENEGKL